MGKDLKYENLKNSVVLKDPMPICDRCEKAQIDCVELTGL
jgi:hypothetical protein